MIRFLILKYYFTNIKAYSTYYLYSKKTQTNRFQAHFSLKKYLLHIAALRLHYRYQINYKVELLFLIKRFGATHKLVGYLMRKGGMRL
jgi:hypothetical protein